MSFGAGHIQDMNNRLKQNRALKPSKRSKFKENNRQGMYSKNGKIKTVDSKKISDEQLIKIKKEIQERAKAERRNEIIVLLILLFCFLIISLGMYSWMN